MPIFEEPLPVEIVNLIPGAAREGAALAGVSLDEAPGRIVEAVNAFVAAPPKKGFLQKLDNWNDRAMPLGALWGSQLVLRFGWQWIMVVEREDGEEDRSIGVFDPRRSIGVYPFDYVFGCLEAKEYPTILLAFNMLDAGSIPAFPDRTFENLMDGVRHIVPPF